MKNTNTKERVLELLFKYPIKSFHMREISKILKISPPAVSKAVKQLEKESLVNTNKKFLYEIRANLENPDFKILKRVYNFKSVYSSKLFEYLKQNFLLNAIILFGSYSRGEDTENSDIDIAIQGRQKKLNFEFYEKILNRRINIEFIDLKKISNEFKNSLLNGIILSGYLEI